MKNSNKLLLLGMGVAFAMSPPGVVSALAQSDNSYQSEDRYEPDTRYQPEQEPDFNDGIWRRPDSVDDARSHDDRRWSRRAERKRRHRAGFGYGHRRGARFLRRYDVDQDGKITQAEFDAAMNKRFARMDIDGDGAITQQELSQRHRRGQSD